MHEAYIYGLSDNPGIVQTPVYTRQFDGCALSLCLVEVYPGMVESSEIVDDGNHKLQRIMGLKVEALETLDRVGGRVGLRKRITGKGFDLSPNL